MKREEMMKRITVFMFCMGCLLLATMAAFAINPEPGGKNARDSNFKYRGLAMSLFHEGQYASGDPTAFEWKWTLNDWKHKIDWMADHDLNTLLIIVRADILTTETFKDIPSMQPYLPYLLKQSAPDAVKRLQGITAYCHRKKMKVGYALQIDMDYNDLVVHFPRLAAHSPSGDSNFLLCPSNPEVRSMTKHVWRAIVNELSGADVFGIIPPDSTDVPCTCSVCSQSIARAISSQVKELYDITKARAPKALVISWVGYGYMDQYAKEYADALPKDVILEIHRYEVFDANELKKALDPWADTGHPIWFKWAAYRWAWIENGKPAPVRVWGKEKIATLLSTVKAAKCEGMFAFCAGYWQPALPNIEDYVSLLQETPMPSKQ